MNDFDAIVAAHSEAVWRTAYRLLNHYDDALDCHQETFLAALRLNQGGAVRAWRAMLVQIATRKAIDRLRQRYQHARAVEASSASGRARAEAPDEQARGAELLEHVRQALAALPPLQAEAFWLRHVEQWSPDEVADEMDIEPGHARVLAHRAAVGLRERLGPSYGPASISEGSP